MFNGEGFWAASLLIAAIVQGCAMATRFEPSPPVMSPNLHQAVVTGVWEGTSITECTPLQAEPERCHAIVNITLTMIQESETVTGFYRCATGTMLCRNLDEAGAIKDGAMRQGGLLAFRVMLHDGSSCLFSGVPWQDRVTGTYLCLQGGGFMERGHWQAQRSY